MLRRRCEIELLAQRLHEVIAHLFPDAHGPVTLHIAVTAYWTDTGSQTSDMTSQQIEIDDRLHIADAISMLRQPHRPAGNHPLALRRDFSRFPDHFPGQAGTLEDFIPGRRPQIRDERLEA